MPPPVVELTSPVTQVAPIDDDGEDSERPTPSPRRAPAPRRAQTASASGDLENTGAYDDLFGKTVFRRIEDAAVRRAEDDDHDEVEVVESTGKVAAPQETVPSDAPSDEDGDAAPVDEHTSSSGDFIDWVPGVGRAAPEIAQAAARRAAAPEAPEPAYPQVHMAERPPAPNTGSRPAPTRQPGPQTPYEQHAPDGHRTPYGPPSQQRQQGPQGQQGQYPQSAPFDQSHAQHLAQPGPSGAYPPYGGPLSSGAAGQQVGYQAAGGNPPQYHHQGPVNPGAAGDQLGFPGAQGPGSPQHSAARQGPAPQGRPAQRPAAPAPAQQPAPARGRHASAPHPVAPGSPASAAPGRPAAPQQGRPGPASAAGPSRGITLPGAVCANGHANPPERTACRVCGAPLSGQIRTVTRPPLGTVTISGGERFVLDRTAIIGRRPRASRVSANDVPQLITVPSPQQDISRSHLELRLEGWHVVALDLGTTNGTTLHREGFESLRLRPSDGVVLHDGDHLDLGDDVHLQFGERT